MLAIEIELLAGRYVATEHNNRWRAEWPPHPARFFSALVAALHDREIMDGAERAALLWLEQQAPPHLDVDLEVADVARRDVRPVFVPVNDVMLVGDPKAELHRVDAVPTMRAMRQAMALLPERRTRQERTLPAVIPRRSTFAFVWPEASPDAHAEPLRQLCSRVTRLGHSSTLVRCAIVERPIEATLVPRSGGEHILRVVGPGQLQLLEEAYARHRAVEPRTLPARAQHYGAPEPRGSESHRSIFSDEWIVLERVGGDRPLSSRGSDLALALRRSLIEVHGAEDLPPALCGHGAGGERTEQSHIAFVPLPWVGHEHADGSVQGIALVMPRSLSCSDRETLLRLLAKWEVERGDRRDDFAVTLGMPVDIPRRLQVRFRRTEVPAKRALQSQRWCKPSRRFVTATPIALDRHPGNLRSAVAGTARKALAEAETSVADACERIGLPRPLHVAISFAPLLTGSKHVREFAPWPARPGRMRRVRIHAEIVFAEQVRGPIVLGAGRFFGLGLCLPMQDGHTRGSVSAES